MATDVPMQAPPAETWPSAGDETDELIRQLQSAGPLPSGEAIPAAVAAADGADDLKIDLNDLSF